MSAALRFLLGAGDLDDARFRHLVGRFHRLGPRALAEFLAELAAERMLRTPIETRLNEYVDRFDRDTLDALDGAELKPIPLLPIDQGGE